MRRILRYYCVSVFLLCHAFIATAQHHPGDQVTVNGRIVRILSENMVANPGFEDGFTSWTDATTTAAQLSADRFTLMTTGGIDNSKYIVGTTNEGSGGAGSIGTGWSIQAGKTYYFTYQVKYQSTTAAEASEQYLKVSLTNNKTASAEPFVVMAAGQVSGAGRWTQNAAIFTNTNYAYIVARFRWLASRFGFDNFGLYEVTEVIDIAGLQQAINEAEALYKTTANGAADFQTAINTAKGFLTSSSGEQVAKAITDLQEAIRKYKIQNASPTDAFDMTPLIVNQGFNDNNGSGWTNPGVVNYHSVEFYEKTFDMYQQISGLPAGKYRLKAQGFERPKGNDAGAAYNAGTETIYAGLYAKSNNFSEKRTPFNSLYKHPYTGSGSSNGFVNTMASAETMFTNAANYYDMSVSDILLDESDVLTIGAKSTFQQGGYWALFDNFRLEYQGAFNASDYVAFINDRIAKAQSLLTQKIQTSAADALNAAITAGQQAVGASPLVVSDLATAKQTLNNAIATANLSIKTYAALQTAINYANKVLGWYSDDQAKKDILQPAVNTATVAVNNTTLTLDQINKATADLTAVTKTVDKKIYIPTWMLGDVNNAENNWSYARSAQSKDWIMFWEKGFNTEDPNNLYYSGTKCDVDWIFNLAEESFHFYADSLKFLTKGKSKTDEYKMIIRLRYTADWEASGSGVDNTIGLLTLTPWAYNSRGGQTAAHEVGHCFQYQVHCDNNDQNGWMYGYGDNASGSNGWWEQCAQWQAYKVMPSQQFNNEWFNGYMSNVHKHTIHEAPRYNNFFIQDYWCHLHGMGIIGRLWNESKKPEDPIEAYQRITGITQTQFNNEMYDGAARFATWDMMNIRTEGSSKIASRPQPKLNNVGDNFWQIDATVCPENYGHNIIQLNAPATATLVTASFQGLAGIDGYRKNYVSEAGWRYGFVALLKDGTRVYGQMSAASMDINAGKDSISFECPANCDKLWLIVSGAPKTHWRHAWDDNDANDEQWPYKIRMGNTNLLGQPNIILPDVSLPVTQLSFRVKAAAGTAQLDWSTSTEINNKGFYIQRSADGDSFTSIGFVASKGNSNATNHYQFIDKTPLLGKSYYRLQQVDLDGKYSYSKALLFDLNAAGKVSVYPNPFSHTLQVNTGNEKGLFIIRDAAGRIVKTIATAEGAALQIQLPSLAAGTYFWQLNGQTGAIIKQ